MLCNPLTEFPINIWPLFLIEILFDIVVKCHLIIRFNHLVWRGEFIFTEHIDGLEQERRNSIAIALELRLSWANPSSVTWWIQIRRTYQWVRAGVKYVLSNTNTNTNTKIWIFQIQIQIQIFCSTLIQIQIQIQIHRFKYKYKYKYVQPNISAETVQIRNRTIVWIPRYILMACVSLCLGDTWS